MFRDLSRPIETGMPTYPGDPEVTLSPDATHAEDGYATSELQTGSHAGTHVDAPRHTLAGGKPVDAVGVGSFALDARLVDLAGEFDAREPITAAALPTAGSVRDDCDLLVVHTGWADRWGADSYRDHPYLTAAAAERCRDLGVGVGLDTFGPDPTPSAPTASKSGDPSAGEPTGTPAHDVLLGAGLPIVENLCSLADLPDRFRLYAFPLRLRDGDGSPVRAVAEWEA
ncbi:cyclase family protein [Halorubrum sp. BV1]|uniref:cyclase family protein n=1 Tax=Halorubrum sp. BV1 TaxID=1498500 RepID=UPI0006799A9C|nr:cyclase family protein [Halorubrum sp. BV1]